MDAVLLDTDVFSYLLKRNDPRAEAYHRHVRGKSLAISFVTVGELYWGAEKRGWSEAKRADLETSLRSVIIVPFDLDVCRAYARLGALKTKDGSSRTIAANDRWIAACAIRHDIPLISNNRRHFDGIPGLNLISEAVKERGPRDQRLPLRGSE
jgi:tRNA(fMet)-specific endonuclease VapC